jgi:hypothetical protein
MVRIRIFGKGIDGSVESFERRENRIGLTLIDRVDPFDLFSQ